MSFILQCGHDVLLLTTRELILRRDGFRVSNATSLSDALRTLARENVDLLLLCHTLNEHELRDIFAIVHTLSEPPRVLTLMAKPFHPPHPVRRPKSSAPSTVPEPFLRRFAGFSTTTAVGRNPISQVMELPHAKNHRHSEVVQQFQRLRLPWTRRRRSRRLHPLLRHPARGLQDPPRRRSRHLRCCPRRPRTPSGRQGHPSA